MTVEWKYCPECGHLEFTNTGYDNGRFCDSCGQEWFPDVNYSKVVIAKLGELAAANERIRKLYNSNRTAESICSDLAFQLTAEREVSDKLAAALEIAIVGACAVGVPHDGERKVLQEAVDIARAALAEVATIRTTNREKS